MDRTHELFLNILRAAIRGGQFTPPEHIAAGEWQRLLRMAAIHKVDSLLLETLHTSGILHSAFPEHAPNLKRQLRQQVIQQTIRTSEFLVLNDTLKAAGIDVIVVKGITCRALYPKPDHRPSADEDLLIRPEDAAACRRVLECFGMLTAIPEQEADNSYEIPYRKPGSPLYIELHKQLFPESSDAYGDLNRFFTDVFDRTAEIPACGGTVRTMGPTDHLFYLLCHAFKHFLHSGFGIRQICDILLFAEHYGDEIDWELILDNCRAIRADRFAAAIFAIGAEHLDFDREQARYPESWQSISVDPSALLQDVLGSGIYGTADSARTHSSTITLDAVAAQKEGRRPRGVIASAFPSARSMESRYPYLKKHPYLLPAAWASRMLGYAKERTSAAGSLKLASERIALLRQYGIID